MFMAPIITAAHPSYAVFDAIFPQDAQRQGPVLRHTRIKYPDSRTCRFAVRRPVDVLKVGHLLINNINLIIGFAWPPANFVS